MQKISLFWFRRDLRIKDNTGLFHALKSEFPVLPIFIFDRHILDKLTSTQDARLTFIHQALEQVQEQISTDYQSSLKTFYGKPEEIFEQLSQEGIEINGTQYQIQQVYTNHDYEPYAIQRDQAVAEILQQQEVEFHTFKDQVIFEKQEILSNTHSPYTVFTPYSKKWKALVSEETLASYDVAQHTQQLLKVTPPLPLITLEAMGFTPNPQSFPSKTVKRALIEGYEQQRNFPGIQGTSRLSVHLRFGTISIREVARAAQKYSETWLNELIWRDFYMMILVNFPHVASKSFKPAYDKIQWRNNEEEFKHWCNGTTGYPIVDAGMRELNTTGFMHNRVRMIVASFLTKHLLIDWRWGEAYFAEKLLDFDLSANNGGWQWASGSGCDAAPYFRVFNPYTQTDKFDKDRAYIRQWVPEYNQAHYAKPIVEHKFARQRALDTYKEGLEKAKALANG
ncbi:deoxyribodipyrimidine photolyase [marine bacterium AO1-C]|nr:deoxyribodipyrimidine photolyase [marine bacterium AO1-C]